MADKSDRDDLQIHKPAQPSSFWSGTISFGLVSVPIDLYSASRSSRVPMRMFGPDGHPLKRRYRCSLDGHALTGEDIVRGYPAGDDAYVVVSDAELDALEPEKTRDIDLRRFVDRDELDPTLFDRSYIMAPTETATKAYYLLAQTMESTHRAGIATFVMRGRQHLVAIYAEEGLLHAATLRFKEELRSPEVLGLAETPPSQVDQSVQEHVARALDALPKGPLDPARLRDEDSSMLIEIARKKWSEERDIIELEEKGDAPDGEDEGGSVIDIMQVLKERLGSKRASSSGASRGEGRAEAESLATSSKEELYRRAQEVDIPGRSRMSKDELIHALQKNG